MTPQLEVETFQQTHLLKRKRVGGKKDGKEEGSEEVSEESEEGRRECGRR